MPIETSDNYITPIKYAICEGLSTAVLASKSYRDDFVEILNSESKVYQRAFQSYAASEQYGAAKSFGFQFLHYFVFDDQIPFIGQTHQEQVKARVADEVLRQIHETYWNIAVRADFWPNGTVADPSKMLSFEIMLGKWRATYGNFSNHVHERIKRYLK
jgi:hypothetical protein